MTLVDTFNFDFTKLARMTQKSERTKFFLSQLANIKPTSYSEPSSFVDKNGITFGWLLPGAITEAENVSCFHFYKESSSISDLRSG
jgi:hypothetical protein